MKEIDSETAKKVMDILSNPEMMSRISAIASGNAPKAPEAPPAPAIVQEQSQAPPSKADLLLAIKPFLREEKRGKIDSLVKALTVAMTFSQIKGGGSKNV